MKNAAIILGLSILVNSCVGVFSAGPENLDEEKDFKTVRIDKEYQLRLPKYMEKGGNINPDASMEYQNPLREVYAVIIAEPKDEFVDMARMIGVVSDSISALRGYFNIQTESVQGAFTNQTHKSFKEAEYNSLGSITQEITGNFPEVPAPIYYMATAIEGKDKMYLLSLWTLDSRKEKYKPTFKKIIKSFKELY